MFGLTRAAYLWMISRMPRLWKLMYEVSDRRNMAEKPVRGIAPVERLLERLLREWKPDAGQGGSLPDRRDGFLRHQ